MMVIDSFLSDFPKFKAHCDSIDYAGMVNPVDGVFYPYVTTHIPEWVKEEVQLKLNRIMRRPVKINALFLRKSPEGVKAPHQAHSDDSMGNYSFMFYVTEGDGGTALVRHKATGFEENPHTDDFVQIWEQDTNVYDAWENIQLVPIKSNRACIFPADKFHRAEPVGGFGEGKEARLVMTAFYD